MTPDEAHTDPQLVVTERFGPLDEVSAECHRPPAPTPPLPRRQREQQQRDRRQLLADCLTPPASSTRGEPA